jgi:cytidine diphosphoramidate kinase
MIIWITGLSGAGKTTIGRLVWGELREREPNSVFVDGDEIRRFMHSETGSDPYSLQSRHELAVRYQKLCKWLDVQGINAVVCTIASFEELRSANRRLFSSYFEVYVSVPLEILLERDIKNLYKRALRGEVTSVVGVDLPFEPPVHPDLTIDNSPDGKDHRVTATEVLDAAIRKRDRSGAALSAIAG